MSIPKTPLSIDGLPIKGTLAAKVGVIEFADFECPFCRTFALSTLPGLVTRYIDTRKAFFAFRQFPLETAHPTARQDAVTAECLQRRGLFWTFYDRKFALSPRGHDNILNTLQQPDRDAFVACQSDAAPVDDQAVTEDIRLGQAIGVTATPTFAFGVLDTKGMFRLTQVVRGAIPLDRFSTIIDATIKSAPNLELR
jgi:protein-disulfide isomerase